MRDPTRRSETTRRTCVVALAFGVTFAWGRASAQEAAGEATQTSAEAQPEAAQQATQPAAAEIESEPEPLESADYTQPRAKRTCSTQDVLRGVCTSEEAAQASAQRIWRLMARADLVMPLVYDSSPETEMLAYYYLGAELDLPFARGLYAVGWVGLSQKFWRIEGQSPVDFEDPLLGIGYRHAVSIGAAHDLVLIHRLAAYLPASRPSRYNLVYTMLDWISAARYPFEVKDVGNFVVGINVWTQVAFRQYTQQDGELITADFADPAGQNTVFKVEAAGLLQYTIFDRPSAGSLLAEASAGYRHRVRYDGAYEPDWYWSAGVTYTPFSYLSASLSLEHGYSDMLRGGVARFELFDRDETFWRIAFFGRY